MDDEKLIQLVSENTVLFDLSHPKYMDPKFKTSVWESIGSQLNMTGMQCKCRWTNIRDHFQRNMKKRKSMTDLAAENRKRYKYEDILQFLVPFTCEKDALANVTVQETSTEGIDDTKDALQEVLQPDAEPNQPQISSSVAARISQGRRRTQNPDAPSARLVKYTLDKDDPQNIPRVLTHDDIDAFLVGIASTLKKLNPYNQHLAKGRIFNVVHELEANEFFNQAPYSSMSPRHSHDSDGSIPTKANNY